jgi:uncharacterized phage protein (TIGR02220 family)
MKWFKHYTDASNDDAINRLEQEYGYEGYGVYWKILEFCAAKYDGKSEPRFSINKVKIKSVLGLTQSKIEKILVTSSQNNLFSLEISENNYEIFFPKLAEIKDNHTKNLQATGKSLASNLPLDKNRIDKKRDKKGDTPPLVEATPPSVDEVETDNAEANALTLLNTICERSYRPVENNLKHIRRLLKAGFKLEDFRAVVEYKYREWGQDSKMQEYLRPETLYGNKFESYLEAARKAHDSMTGLTLKEIAAKLAPDFKAV